MSQTWRETTTTSRMISQIVQIVFVLLEREVSAKSLVWAAICKCGVSKPLIRRSKSEAVNSDIYIKECLEKRMLPFIREHHLDSNYIFWPDLASCHHSKQTVGWMDENVKFVPKYINPPNVPQARPIENFWGCLAQKVNEGGWEAKTEHQLIRRIKSKMKEFDKILWRAF